MNWVVTDFVQEKHFGFCGDLDSPEVKVFFHARDFIRLKPGETGPILGETVIVDKIEYQTKGFCAKIVKRKISPTTITGSIVSYSPQKGWGFILGNDRQEYYFHKKELLGSWVPLPGISVEFSGGNIKGKPRACWVSQRRK